MAERYGLCQTPPRDYFTRRAPLVSPVRLSQRLHQLGP